MDYISIEENLISNRLTDGIAKYIAAKNDAAAGEAITLTGRVGDSHYEHLTILLDDCMRILNEEKDIDPYKLLNPDHLRTGKLDTFIRRMVRKLTYWYVVPQVRQQVIFNNVLMNTLEHSEKKRQITNEQLSEVNKELLELQRKMEKILKRNEFSDILDTWEHEY